MRRARLVILLGAAVAAVVAIGDVDVVPAIIAVLAATGLMKMGVAILKSLAQPPAEPPPPGELRKVKIEYRCDICGAELRMTLANDEMPDPPKHCLEEMVLVTPVE